MTNKEFTRIKRELKPFQRLFLTVACLGLLSSCGGSGSEGRADTATAQDATKQIAVVSGGTVPAGWVGRAPANPLQSRVKNGFPASVEISESIIFESKRVAARQIIVIPKRVYVAEIEKFIKSQRWTTLAKSGLSWQVDVGDEDLRSAINKIDSSGFGWGDLNVLFSHNVISELNDPLPISSDQYRWNIEAINAKGAWSLVPEGRSVQIGVLDGGFRFGHQDLDFSRIANGTYDVTEKDFSIYCKLNDGVDRPVSGSLCENATHGMNVAGIISAKGNNGVGVAGVAWMNNKNPIGYKTDDFSAQSVFAGIEFLIDSGSKIINMSLGYRCEASPCSYLDRWSMEHTRKVTLALMEKYPEFPDVLIVQSSGNNGGKNLAESNRPVTSEYNSWFATIVGRKFDFDKSISDYIDKIRRHVIIVGAYESGKSIAGYTSLPSSSALEKTPFLIAPGGHAGGTYVDKRKYSIYSNVAGPAFSSTDKYIAMAGTSQAAPHVSGVAALVFLANDALTSEEVANIVLSESDTSLGEPYKYRKIGDGSDGYRYLNAEAAVKEALARKKSFFDDFSGATLDTSKWSSLPCRSAGDPTFAGNGQAHFGSCQSATTQGKVTFSGKKIVIEARFAGQKGAGRDTAIALVNAATGDFFQFGDTDYEGRGMYAYLYYGGKYEVIKQYGGTTNAFKEYRVTVEGMNVKIQRGDSLSNLTETHTATLPYSATDGTYYLRIGTGADWYAPADFDWINVYTDDNYIINVDAKQFTAASTNIAVETSSLYSCRAGLVYNAPPYTERANAGEWIVNASAAGTYLMEANYAALESRPLKVSVNATVVTASGLSNVTGGWCLGDAKTYPVGVVTLKAGANTLRLDRASVFPHLASFRFTRQQ